MYSDASVNKKNVECTAKLFKEINKLVVFLH